MGVSEETLGIYGAPFSGSILIPSIGIDSGSPSYMEGYSLSLDTRVLAYPKDMTDFEDTLQETSPSLGSRNGMRKIGD